MSSPIQITRPTDPADSRDEQAQAAARKLPSLHDFFSPGGVLSRSDLAFEHRKGQYEMARAIEKAFADKRHLIVEAGTGTGKTLAYLLPALRLARERQQRVIISTGTKNLQEQLFFKDVPFLESILGPLKVCYMKGRGNYLCKHKLYALRDSPLLTGLEEISQFHAIAAWEKTTATGDRAEIDALPESSALWPKLDARGEACLGQTCPDWENCFITAMRRKALESDIVIVNHHLFFADMSHQAAGRRIAPTQASSPQPAPSSSTRRTSSKRLPATTLASASAPSASTNSPATSKPCSAPSTRLPPPSRAPPQPSATAPASSSALFLQRIQIMASAAHALRAAR